MKKLKTVLISAVVAVAALVCVFGAACGKKQSLYPDGYVDECYSKIQYIDKKLSDRDCIAGKQFKAAQKWIKNQLVKGGYSKNDIKTPEMSFKSYISVDKLGDVVADYTVEGYYKRENRKYIETTQEEAQYVRAEIKSNNITVTKKGKSDKQIIVGAHYDGDGTGDNGSGVALALTIAAKVSKVELPHTVVFVFFTAEEYGCYGSTAYANAMSEAEVENTLYMVNMDSLICGDYCYLYGGVQNQDNTVTKTEAYDNAMALAQSLGLDFKTNPWTVDNPAPGYDEPDYVSPSTGDWSDHQGFKNRGIMYVYFEATNWEIPGPYEEYDGYGETYLIGMLMNTENDYLEFIEKYFPGRPQEHLKKFFTLLDALLIQPELPWETSAAA